MAAPLNNTQTWSGFADKTWQVHKFGGTSVANADCYRSAARIVEDQLGINDKDSDDDDDDDNKSGDIKKEEHLAVVVSAMGSYSYSYSCSL
mmetsp:Transcript_43519/g.47209  ORF Transcript_43519/g.47209 Transcript_43519/m.47209 type:complete len:91 (-) Transcript_43519:15-287(-)